MIATLAIEVFSVLFGRKESNITYHQVAMTGDGVATGKFVTPGSKIAGFIFGLQRRELKKSR